MKRSEMLEFMTDEFWKSGRENPNAQIREVMDKILARMERIGMVPPSLSLNDYGEPIDHVWEPEDER